MQNTTRKIVTATVTAAVVTGMGVTAYLFSKRETELQALNTELHVYGYTDFEPSLKNARAKVDYVRNDSATITDQFTSILEDNDMI